VSEDGKPLIYTMGTSTRTLEEFLAILEVKRIKQIADVRSFPGSRRYPYFSREALAEALRKAGIGYFWLGAKLGGFRKGGYEAWMLGEDFAEGLAELEELARRAATVIICAEAVPWRCHRRYIGFALEDRGWDVIHIIDASHDWRFMKRPQTLPLEHVESV
jgi:uncharacterized protein (DUF488 family)